MLRDRFSLLYRFLLDPDTNTWVDLTPQVDSQQTVITQNLCSTAFKSAKDEASFVMPETNLFEADGVTLTPKKKLIDKIMSGDDVLVQINAPGDVNVQWNGEDVLWNGEHVQWRGSVRYFTGYVDRSSITLRSYPLPPRLEVKLQDVSTLHLDDKVDYYITLVDDPNGTRLKISTVVATLLGYAGYTDIGSLALDVADDEILEAFVIDKDSAKTYRQYIDTLLFEAGGYVLDFNANGQANVVHLKWDGSDSASRNIDNPMNSDGVSMKSAYLKEDGVSVKWSSLAWTGPDKIIYNADIQQAVDESGNMTGVKVPMNTFWPEGGETAPNYFQYQEERLDLPYFQNATKFKNDDVSMIMAKDIWVDMDALRNNRPYDGWTYVNPTTWPAGDNWNDKYGIPTNPCLWPKKAWYLIYNPQWPVVTPNGTENPRGEGWFVEVSTGVYALTNDTTVQPGTTYYLGATYTAVTSPDPLAIPVAEHWYEESAGVYTISDDLTVDPNKTYYKAEGGDADLLFFTIHGNVLYRYKLNVVDMQGSKNPKEYESTYIYNQSHAERFTQFYWHFLQTSRYQFTWSEPNMHSALNDVVAVGVKGNNSTQKALIAGKTSRWINDNVEIISYTAVGIDTYSPASLVPISVVPSSNKQQVQPVFSAIVAELHTAAVKTLAEWQDFVGVLSTWGVDNVSDFTAGDVAIINGTISDMNNLPITLYISVSDVDSVAQTISGSGIKIEYVPTTEVWDFELGASSVATNMRLAPYSSVDPNSYTDIQLTSLQKGFGQLEYWSCTGTVNKTFFGSNPGPQTTTGSAPILRVTKDETVSEITVTMHTLDNSQSISRTIKVIDETEYEHDFGLWQPNGGYDLPDHFTVGGVDYAVIEGDFFVAEIDFNVTGYPTFKEGTPYEYDGNSWVAISATTPANAKKLLRCLGNVLGSDTVQPSTAAIYGWFENLAAKSAVIENLFSQHITILDNGCIHSEYYNDDGSLNLTASIDHTGSGFTVTLDIGMFLREATAPGIYKWICDDSNAYWDKETGNPLKSASTANLYNYYGISISGTPTRYDTITVTVTSASGSSKGFWLGADGTLKCYSADMDSITISGESFFHGAFDCDVIKTEAKKSSSKSYAVSNTTALQGYYLAKALVDDGCVVGAKYPADIYSVNSPIAYLSVIKSPRIRSDGNYEGEVAFYDSNYNPVNIAVYMTIKKRYHDTVSSETNCTSIKSNVVSSGGYAEYNSYYSSNTYTVRVYSGGNALTVNIPSSPSGLSSGQMFRGATVTIDGVQCRPVYVVN